MVLTIINAVLALAAGIGVFLVAIKLMSSNLETVSGNKLKALFAKTSKNKLIGVGIGTAATAAIQSSGAVTVMVIGFVNAGLMSLTQAATIIFGANIGTTVTGQIVALGLFGGDAISTTVIFSAFAGAGAFMMYFAKKDLIKRIGGILAGFGMIFVGLAAMSNSMSSFATLPEVINFLAKIDVPLLLVIIGAALTALVQSSSVMTSIAITMVFTGLINLDQGIYLTLGSNIGSCVVAIIAGMGSSENAKRTALIHLIFNVAGVVVFMLIGMIMRLASSGAVTFGRLFELMFPDAPQMQLAMFHTVFNIVTVALILPFTGVLVKLVTRALPDGKHGKKGKAKGFTLKYLDDRFLKTPPIAVEQVKKEVASMAQIAIENFNTSLDTVCSLDFSNVKKFKENESYLNFLNAEIVRYIIRLSKTDLSEKDNIFVSTVFHSASDLERIGDYAENIMEYADKLRAIGSGFSADAVDEIKDLKELISSLYKETMKVFTVGDLKALRNAYILEDSVDDITAALSANHIKRLDAGLCSPDIGAQYLSLTANAERVADHLFNIAKAVPSYLGNAAALSIEENNGVNLE